LCILDTKKLTGMPCKLSSPSDIDDIIHKIVAVNVNWNGDEWNFNANDLDNNDWWNEGNVFLFPDTIYFLSNYFREVLFSIDIFTSILFFHPPRIFPTSCNLLDNSRYGFSLSNLFSQAI